MRRVRAMNSTADLLKCEDLTKKFGKDTALDNISFSLDPGHIVGLLGPNGAGKTTLIKMAAGLLTPTSGAILIDGDAPGVYSKGIVSYLPERTYLNESMTPDQTIKFFSDFYEDFDPERAGEMMESLNVNRTKPVKNLSKGTKEKLQLILVMSRNARLYLLDEPIGGVDPAARDYILNTILQNYEEDATVIISTHLIADVEQILDEVLFLQDGKLILQESVDTIREERGLSVDETFREVFRC